MSDTESGAARPGKVLRVPSLSLHLQNRKMGAAFGILSLAKAKQRLAEVQSRLGEHPDAWATLTEALALLQSSLLAQATEWEEARLPMQAAS